MLLSVAEPRAPYRARIPVARFFSRRTFRAPMGDPDGDIERLLASARQVLRRALAPPPRTNAEAAELLTVSKAAAILGVRPGRVYELVSAGTLPSVRVGRSIRIPSDQLRAWIAGGGTDGVRPPAPRKMGR